MMNSRTLFSRLIAFALAILLINIAHCAQARQAPPAGSKGWWYYTGANSEGGYAADPITACKKNAENQMGTPLLAMRPAGNSAGVMSCKYAHFIGSPNDGEWYGTTILSCNPGYFARSDGDSATFSYDTQNRLVLIADGSGRTVKIAWHGGEVESIEGPNGGVRYQYEQVAVPGQDAITGMARLDAVHFHDRDGTLVASRRYHYEHESNRYLLTGITDENGARFATYAYDAFGSVVLSEHAGGAGRYTFDYSSESARRITDPLGTERILSVSYLFGDTRGRITSESQPAGAGCSAGASALTYAADGNLASSTNFNGQKTCFVTDSARGLETRRIGGLPASASCPAGVSDTSLKTARMISTQWHPDWPMKSAVAEANRITTYVYNGERGADGQVAHCAGDVTLPNGKPIAVLCSMTIQATTDNNGTLGFAAAKAGAARTWQYTYNTAGQLLSRTGPADASGNIDSARLTYYADTTDGHTSGDLASATNGAGEVTQFTKNGYGGRCSEVTKGGNFAQCTVF